MMVYVVHTDMSLKGGIETVTRWLVDVLRAEGHEVRVVTRESAEAKVAWTADIVLSSPGRTPSMTAAIQRRGCARALAVLSTILGKARSYLRDARTLRQAIRGDGDRYAVICQHRIMLPYVLLAGVPRRRIILSVHRPTGYWRSNRARWARARAEFALAGTVVALTPEDVAQLPKRFVRAKAIPNPAPDAVEADHDPEHPPTVAWVGRMVDVKRLDLVAKTFSLARQGRPEWRLLLIGDGPCRPSLEQLLRELDLMDVTTITGYLDDARPLLAAADIFLMTSDVEGWSMALAEAAVQGIAPVARDCGPGVRAMLEGMPEALVSSERPADLALALERVMDDSALRAKLGLRAKSGMERFAPGTVAQMWSEVLRGVA